ncbi:MAG: type IV pili methyl-accepting chemotaxis transducer N-terminal domain-containing protein [Rhodobacteraceae bacterium]|nr:type IV pili methyl-accepting chemotaxis transducer N-terminal domain-containing protein [Paracoccaceae bacterium]
MRVILGVLTLLACLPLGGAMSSQAFADISIDEDAKRKINYSGRQRMLTQFMAKSVCFADMQVRFDHHLNEIGKTHYLFDETLKALRHGSKIQGMLVETHQDVLAALDVVEAEWAVYGQAVKAWWDRPARNPRLLETIYTHNVPTLRTMNDAVGLFEKTYAGKGVVAPGLAQALNVSGRQRMLTQKASKEFCLIASGHEVEANRAALAATIELFTKSHDGLMYGDAEVGLPAAPATEIAEQLKLVGELWGKLEPALMEAANPGASPSPETVAAVAELNEPVLIEMNKAVMLYEKVAAHNN